MQNKSNVVELEILKAIDDAYALRSSDIKSSIKIVKVALKKAREIKNDILIGKCLVKLGLFKMISTDNNLSLEYSLEALEYLRIAGDAQGQADAMYNIASVYYRTNNFHKGMFHLIDCLALYKKLDDKPAISRTLKSLATIHELLGNQQGAINSYNETLQCGIAIGDKNLQSNVYNPLSGIMLKMGQVEDTQNLINKSVKLKIETGDRRGYAFAIYGRGKVNLHIKNYEQAESDFYEALEIHMEVGDSFGIGQVYSKLARLYFETGDIERSTKILKDTIVHSENANLSLMKFKCYHRLYHIYKEEGNIALALEYLEMYLSEKESSINSQTLKVIENYESLMKMTVEEQENKLKQASEVAALKQEFLSAMSHEIRTPLNAFTSIIALLKDRKDDEEKKLLTSLQFSSKNLLRIINDILDFSKLESNKMILEPHPADFKNLVENIKDTYKNLAVDKGIDLVLAIDTSLNKTYNLDETKLFQIIGNLISNGIKFTDYGSVSIEASLVHSDLTSDVVEFKIQDTGRGIRKEDIKKLFESFYIPQSVSTRNDGGTGLGLAKWGVTMIRACDGVEAVTIANTTKVDFILMDIHMPEMNGFEAATSIKQKGLNIDTPIFALTADVTASQNQKYDSLFDAYLWKPIEMDKLRRTLANHYKSGDYC